MTDVATLLKGAIQLHQQNRLNEAQLAYNQVLLIDPNQPTALHHLGILDLISNRLESARTKLAAAVAVAPQDGGVHFHLGELARREGRNDDAVSEFRRATMLSPNLLVAFQALGELLIQLNRPGEAVEPLAALVNAAPELSGGWLLLGKALLTINRRDEAAKAYAQVARLMPRNLDVLRQYGDLELSLGRPQLAVPALQAAVELQPADPILHSNLARALDGLARYDRALPHHRRAAELMPASATALNNYGISLHRAGRVMEAENHLRRAAKIDPSSALALTNLGSVLHEQGRHAEALESYRRAMKINPGSARIHSTFLYLLHFNSSFDQSAVATEHQMWARKHLRTIPRVVRESVNKDPERKLRVGYLSADFRQHVVGRFLEPVLQHRDRERFEMFCYSDTTAVDVITSRLRENTEGWRDTAGLDDAALAELISQDQVDILLDVTGHMDGSRLLTFARQAALVQISHIGYPASSGVPAIHYRVTDRHLDPPAPRTGEHLLYMPESFYLYRPEVRAPEPVGEPPVVANGFVTFGSLNSPKKISAAAIGLWAGALKATPRSKLMLIVLPDTASHGWLIGEFKKLGIGPDRLLLEPSRDYVDYMSLYNRIDIALDPQPYGGGITTCDAIWMGVPVVSLIGRTSVGRIGASLLASIGLTELLVEGSESYSNVASTLAEDSERLAAYRKGLRAQLAKSVIMDEARYTKNLENLYREAWRAFCAGEPIKA